MKMKLRLIRPQTSAAVAPSESADVPPSHASKISASNLFLFSKGLREDLSPISHTMLSRQSASMFVYHRPMSAPDPP